MYKSQNKTSPRRTHKKRHYLYKRIKKHTKKIYKFIDKRLKSPRHLHKLRHHLYYY